MSRQLLEHIAKKINDEENQVAYDLALGKAKDFGDYKYSAGIIRGYMVAKNILIEISEQLDKEDGE